MVILAGILWFVCLFVSGHAAFRICAGKGGRATAVMLGVAAPLCFGLLLLDVGRPWAIAVILLGVPVLSAILCCLVDIRDAARERRG